MKPNKLVRDKIPQIIKENGEYPIIHIAGDNEYRKRLGEKLLEEVGEFLEEYDVRELADVLEVVYALGNFIGVDNSTLELMRKSKFDNRGGFLYRIILDEVKER